MANLTHVQAHDDSVEQFWRIHGLHALNGDEYAQRWKQEIYTANWASIIQACIEHGELAAGKRALEVGCGWGRIIVGLKQAIPELMVCGVDLVPELIEHAKKVVPAETGREDVTFLTADARSLPFPDASFDTILSARVLQYMPDPVNAVKEFVRVVEPGGRVVILLPNRWNPLRWGRYPAKLYSPQEIAGWLVAAGLTEIDARSICFLPQWRRLERHLKLLPLESLQRLPVVDQLGGLAAVSGRRLR